MKKTLTVVFLSVALNVIFVNAAFSNTQPQETELAEVAKAEIEIPLCYLQTPDGKILNLNKLCEQTPNQTTSVAVVNPYNNATIKKFDDELYGKGN